MKKEILQAATGKAIRAFREEKGLSQIALAEKCHLDRTYIGGVERGERNITLWVLHKISIALELEMSEILKRAESNIDE